jgi:hypothetical protein
MAPRFAAPPATPLLSTQPHPSRITNDYSILAIQYNYDYNKYSHNPHLVRSATCKLPAGRAVFTHRGPGSGRHIKKIEIEVWYADKKRLSTREKFKGDLY